MGEKWFPSCTFHPNSPALPLDCTRPGKSARMGSEYNPDGVDEYRSGEEDEYDSDEESSKPFDDGIDLRPMTQSLGLSSQYAPQWTCADAFREFYQNWKDGIVASFSLDPRNPQSFQPKWSETNAWLEITVRRGSSPAGELLGFIRFKKKGGHLELANFDARLERKHLNLGASSKREENGSKFAGFHGEGFKMAALVMRRNGYSVRISTNSFYWNFNFNNSGILRCRLSKPADITLFKESERKQKEESKGPHRTELNSYMAHDVLVRIKGVDGRQMSADTFRSWAAVALDLKHPLRSEDMVRTASGDLILDPEFAGSVYLKGLRVRGLAGRKSADEVYRFAYNFAEGYINRDREFLTDGGEGARTVAKIWAESIANGGEATIQHYLHLFEAYKESKDIYLADRFVSKETALAMWKHLVDDTPGAFYYAEGAGAAESASMSDDQRHQEIIETALKKQPKKMDATLWKILWKHNLVRTPHEERCRIFQKSEVIAVKGHFAESVLRLLSAAFQLHDLTVTICVVSGGDTGVDLLCVGGGQNGPPLRLLVHEKWFNFTEAHVESDCDLSALSGLVGDNMSGPVNGFYCDHVVFDLFDMAIRDTRGPLQLNHQQIAAIRRKFSTAVGQMPRRVQLSRSQDGAGLVVAWTPNEIAKIVAESQLNICYNIRLHKASSCAESRKDLVYTEQAVENFYDAEDVDMEDCDCPAQTVGPDGYKGVSFKGLDPAEQYFPMVARAGGKSLFATPPSAISPRWRVAPTTISRCQSQHVAGVPVLPPAAAHSEPDPPPASPSNSSNSLDDVISDSPDTPPFDGGQSPVFDPMLDTPDTPFDGAQSPASDPGAAPEALEQEENPTLAMRIDEDEWREWHEHELPSRISRFFGALAPAKQCRMCGKQSSNLITEAVFTCDRLGYEFEEESFVEVKLRDPEIASGRPSVLFVHRIHLGDDEGTDCSLQGPHIAATRYTHTAGDVAMAFDNYFLSQHLPVGDLLKSSGTARSMEFLLHCSGPGDMGTRDDADVISMDDILSVTALPPEFDIVHCVNPPAPEEIKGKGFCRFACSVEERGLLLTPLSRQSLPRLEARNRRKLDGFVRDATPHIVDFSPSVLGTSEGFLDAGYNILASVGFDGQKHHTWRVRHPRCRVFDGEIESVVDEFVCGKLPVPHLTAPGHPFVASLASEYSLYRLGDGNKEMPSLDGFLQPLKDMTSVMSCPAFGFHFSVLQLPVAILRDDHDDTSSNALFDYMNHFLCELGHSVALRVLSVSDYGLPQDRQVVVIMTSPYLGPNVVDQETTAGVAVDEMTLHEILKGLTINNTRPTYRESDGADSLAMCFVDNNVYYNHGTGRKHPDINECISVDPSGNTPGGIQLFYPSARPHVNKERVDLLTVRELARLQGFKDDFIFYGAPEAQYREVLTAQPPIVSREIGKMLRRVMELNTSRHVTRRNTGVAAAVQNEGVRPNKRARVEDAEDQG
ncbi:hypothetical protein B0T14DRAFT_525935 [Immersiella caudata]|uniref:Uncharacterized protein n=1 Tax=Immersiella caudata TaxID=314043 RepID=A0AA40BTP3_9PEZI|nr:hypothetical protein B0T14DRAFT_525935 [Immersiella caudata]